jgi:hypothetical protein
MTVSRLSLHIALTEFFDMHSQMLIASIKSALIIVILMLVQHLDELWRGGLSLSPVYLLICAGVGLLFIVFAYQFHSYRSAKNPAYDPEWLYSPLIYISVPVALIVLTVWRS